MNQEWKGDVWIKDNWTDEEKAQALNRLRPKKTTNGSEKPNGGIGQTKHSSHEELNKRQQALNQFHRNASTNWNVFYDQNQNKFFKDRHYLHKAFPLEFGWLYSDSDGVVNDDDMAIPTGDTSSADGTDEANNLYTRQQSFNHWKDNKVVSIVEIGCGVGNAILPLLEQHSRLMEQQTHSPELPQLHIHCLDFAPNAIQILKEDKRFQSAACEGRATAHVYDLSSMHPSTISIGSECSRTINTQHSTAPKSLANSADVAILLFCLSAIGPRASPDLSRAARHVMDMLKPGGILVIRDYGRLDEAQLKLGGNKEMGENFYRKGDGTGCYYFELNDLRDLFGNGMCHEGPRDKMDVLELEYIQRVYRNRGDGTTRRRVWVQGRFQKPLETSNPSCENTPCRSGSLRLQEFFKNSIQSWDNYYKIQADSSSMVSLNAAMSAKFPNNLLQIFPGQFQRWQSLLNTCQSYRKNNDASKIQNTQTDASALDAESQFLSSGAEFSIVDVGCGLGNGTLLNILATQAIDNTLQEDSLRTCPRLKVYFVDASRVAIGHLRNDPRFKCAAVDSTEDLNARAHSRCATTQVLDITTSPFLPSNDMALLLFTLSSIGPYHKLEKSTHSSQMRSAVANVSSMLKPGGVVLFRDFGRYDDDQLQLNSCFGSQICDNFYFVDEMNQKARGTAVYFFDLKEVRELFTTAGFEVLQMEYINRIYSKSGKHANNLLVNGGAVRRTRVWVHAVFRKI